MKGHIIINCGWTGLIVFLICIMTLSSFFCMADAHILIHDSGHSFKLLPLH
jgi:hypothetical protein